MKILKMRASFGKLHGELTLQEGMNILTLPNEEGKSTWSAFLLAMLYGIDTKERSSVSNGGLPTKERYRPWNGDPMEGSIDLEWKGKLITIERTSTPKGPMSRFRAFDTRSGRPIELLNGDNCGRLLCGVERSVFERTAFIRQLGMSINGDDALEKRLGALVSTGEESAKSAQQLEKELLALKNRLSGRVGKVSKLQTELTETERLRSYMSKLREETADLEKKRQAQQEEFDRLDAHLQRIRGAKHAQGQITLRDLGRKVEAQEELCRNIEQLTRGLPPESNLHRLQKRLEAAEAAVETAKMEAAFAPPVATEPLAPSCFEGLTPEEAEKKVHEDLERFHKATSHRFAFKPIAVFLSLLLFLGLGALSVWSYLHEGQPVPFPLSVGMTASALCLFLAVTIFMKGRRSRSAENLAQAQAVLRTYKVVDISEIPEILEDYVQAWKDYDCAVEEDQERSRNLVQRLQREQRNAEEILWEIQDFAPEAQTVEDGKRILAEALAARESLTTEKRVLENQRAQYSRMKGLFGRQERWMDSEIMNMDEEKFLYEYRVAQQKLADLSDKLSEHRGRMAATGDMGGLDQRKQELKDALQQANADQEKIDIALRALRSADDRVRSRFSPQITSEAGKILSELTGGKYPSLQLSPDMQLSVRDGILQRPAAAMSCGTGDQMYLALRLAMCRRLLPKEAPLLLDDALVNFDDDRCAMAVELLTRESEQRQVILFTCRTLQ
ncbi:MAG: hypothetical protein IKT58_02265 [Oscillospiraceae bacterium]|nr:hypothetical protein [Oscillospiraceae bacterium]